MAPEQLEGEDADARTDISAFGAILYEMVTGKKAFEGKSQASLISAIMTADPTPMTVFQPITPPGLDHIVRVCLAKNPDERWQSAGDLVRELKWIATNTAQIPARSTAAIAPQPGRLPWKIATISLAVVALAASVFVTIVLLRPAPVQVIRFQITAPENTSLRTLTDDNSTSISPDGTRIAFVATDSLGKTLIWTRSLDSFSAQALAGTDGAQFPFWSADSRFVGFFAQGKLRKIDTSGGPPRSAMCRGYQEVDHGIRMDSFFLEPPIRRFLESPPKAGSQHQSLNSTQRENRLLTGGRTSCRTAVIFCIGRGARMDHRFMPVRSTQTWPNCSF
jgi:hypothetical protein